MAAYSVVMHGCTYDDLTDPTDWNYEPAARAWVMGWQGWSPPSTSGLPDPVAEAAAAAAEAALGLYADLENGGWNPLNWHRWLYTGQPDSPDDQYGEALEAAGESYVEEAGLAHQSLQALGSLGRVVSSTLSVIEGADLHEQIMFEQAAQDARPLGPDGGLVGDDWNRQLMRTIRDDFGNIVMAAQILDTVQNQPDLKAAADAAIGQARTMAVEGLMTLLLEEVRQLNDARLEDIADKLEMDGRFAFTPAQLTELAAQETFLISIENQIASIFHSSVDLDPTATITSNLAALEATAQAEAARLASLPPTVLGGNGVNPPIGAAAQQIIVNQLLAVIPQLRQAVPSLVFSANVYRMAKSEIEAAQANGEFEEEDSGNEIVRRDGIAFREENGTLIYGRAQNTSKANDPNNPHMLLVEQKVNDLAASGQYEVITMNLAWRTATGRKAESRLLPDIIAIEPDGSVLAIEIQSPGQNYKMGDPDSLYDKLDDGHDSFTTTKPAFTREVYDLNDTLLPDM